VGFGIKLYGTISSTPGLAGDLQNPVKPLQAVFDNYSDECASGKSSLKSKHHLSMFLI